eukprot:m.259967 g.259967  ORF g.259967 m.259967 type:complete len:312 (-) comp38965_c0_seq1:551-1486(-)
MEVLATLVATTNASSKESSNIEGEVVKLFDPSEFRPDIAKDPPVGFEGKDKALFRDYVSVEDTMPQIRECYTTMHTEQTVDYVEKQKTTWCKFDRIALTVMEALDLLNKVIDESDPDTDIPNIVHSFQTAERIRELHPDQDWFHLVGLIHDLGKIMAYYGQPQWSTVGDTFPVGCKPADTIVFPETFTKNPDVTHEVYGSELGMYEQGCGISNLNLSWGHDEYLYRVLVNHGCNIPEQGLWMVRFHSFYPWHTGKSYTQFADAKDKEMMDWVLEFNKFDLYSKADKLPNIEELKPYYQGLVDKYMPGKIKF